MTNIEEVAEDVVNDNTDDDIIYEKETSSVDFKKGIKEMSGSH